MGSSKGDLALSGDGESASRSRSRRRVSRSRRARTRCSRARAEPEVMPRTRAASAVVRRSQMVSVRRSLSSSDSSLRTSRTAWCSLRSGGVGCSALSCAIAALPRASSRRCCANIRQATPTARVCAHRQWAGRPIAATRSSRSPRANRPQLSHPRAACSRPAGPLGCPGTAPRRRLRCASWPRPVSIGAVDGLRVPRVAACAVDRVIVHGGDHALAVTCLGCGNDRGQPPEPRSGRALIALMSRGAWMRIERVTLGHINDCDSVSVANVRDSSSAATSAATSRPPTSRPRSSSHDHVPRSW